MFKSTILAALAIAAFSGSASGGILDVNPYGEDTWGVRKFHSMDRRPTSDLEGEERRSSGFSNRWRTQMPEALPAIVPYGMGLR